MIRNSTIKIISLLLIVGLIWTGFSAVLETFGYYNDTETSLENGLSAGTLDIYLTSEGWQPGEKTSNLMPGDSITKIKSIANIGTLDFQHTIELDDFSGELCQALELEANFSGDAPEYQGPLTGFEYEPTLSGSGDWVFTITFPSEKAEASLQGKNCQFKFKFFGWQDNLEPEQGFSDSEEEMEIITAGTWVPAAPVLLTPLDGAVINGTSVTQCWTGIEGASKYIYQSCYNDPDADEYCQEKIYAEYEPGDPEFSEACKTAIILPDGTFWWHVKAEVGDYQTNWSDAWKITINNSHFNKFVINEFLPNPVGDDSAPMPDGEWVELYNNKGVDVDVGGWALYDAFNSHELIITNSNTNTGSTLIRSGGFLVVYRNEDSDFDLNNTGGEWVRLFNKPISQLGLMVDFYGYLVSALEGKSFARIPDGSHKWFRNSIPTPGKPNTLEGSEEVFGPALPEEGPEEGGEEEEENEEKPEFEQLEIEQELSELEIEDIIETQTPSDEPLMLPEQEQEIPSNQEETSSDLPEQDLEEQDSEKQDSEEQDLSEQEINLPEQEIIPLEEEPSSSDESDETEI